MHNLRWVGGGQPLQLQQTGEPHLWKVVSQTDPSGQDYGYIAVYVDDLLLAVTEAHMEPLITALRSAWTCSEPEYVTSSGTMRFCGFEIKKIPGGYQVGQEGFATEMLKRRQVKGFAKFPLPTITDDSDESPLDLVAVRQAQGRIGSQHVADQI